MFIHYLTLTAFKLVFIDSWWTHGHWTEDFSILTRNLQLNGRFSLKQSVSYNTTKTYCSGQVFGYRVGDGPYNWITYREAEKTIQSFRRGLVKIGLAGRGIKNILIRKVSNFPLYSFVVFNQYITTYRSYLNQIWTLMTPICLGGQDKLVGIFAKNSPEWHMSMQGIVGNGSIAVPLYQTLGVRNRNLVIFIAY